ncbi:MAG: LysR family transcriptional regulator [Burkholderiales bacterium]|nr:LysR family transcriptional regulator [Burkholderiales bacterium]
MRYGGNRIEALQILQAFQETGSLRATADALARVPTALTYAIRKIERDLGAPLFVKSGRGLDISATGLRLLKDGKDVLNALTLLEEKIRHLAPGGLLELRVVHDSLIPFRNLIPFIADLAKAQPYTTIHVREEVLQDTWESMAEGSADLLIGAAGDGSRNVRVHRQLLGHIEFAFVAAPSHSLARQTHPVDLDTCYQHMSVVPREYRRSTREPTHLKAQTIVTVSGLSSMVDLMVAGAAAGFAPLSRVAALIETGQLVRLQTSDALPARPVYLVWRNGLPQPFIDFCREWFASDAGKLALESCMLSHRPG